MLSPALGEHNKKKNGVDGCFFVFVFRAELSHDPCDRHAYNAVWTRDLEQRTMTAQVKGLAEFLKKYAIGMFDHGSDQSFILLQHHFIMLGRAKGPMTKHECMPLCLHSFESLVAPEFLDSLEAWMVSTQAKLEKFSIEFEDSHTLHRVASLKTHSDLVELEVCLFKKIKNKLHNFFLFLLQVGVQYYSDEELSKFKLVDQRGIVLTYRFAPGVIETLPPPPGLAQPADLERERARIESIKNYSYIR